MDAGGNPPEVAETGLGDRVPRPGAAGLPAFEQVSQAPAKRGPDGAVGTEPGRRDWYSPGVQERRGTSVGIERSEAGDESKPLALAAPLPRLQKVDIDMESGTTIAEVHPRPHLEELVGMLIAAGREHQLDDLGVATLPELVRVEGEIDIDAPDVRLLGIAEQEIRDPPAHHDDAVLEERAKHLSEIDKARRAASI